MKKQKTYVLIISEYFPAKHPRAGQPTGFDPNSARLGSLFRFFERE